MTRQSRSALVLLAPALVLLAACSSGGSGPTAPSGPQASLATSWGPVTVFTNGHAFDADRALASIENGYSRARAQVGSGADSISLAGLAISVTTQEALGAYGEYHADRDVIDMAQGIENVLSHELQHRFCHELGRSGSCCTLQDHPNGFDLNCSAR